MGEQLLLHGVPRVRDNAGTEDLLAKGDDHEGATSQLVRIDEGKRSSKRGQSSVDGLKREGRRSSLVDIVA